MRAADRGRHHAERKLVRVEVLLGSDIVASLDAHARSARRNRSGVITETLLQALHDLAITSLDELWKTSGAERRIEDLLGHTEDLFALAQVTAQRVFSTHRLLVHWVTRAGTLQVTEDELRAEIRAAGEDAVQQILYELQEPRSQARAMVGPEDDGLE